eukprot:5958689-Amphidinium_carterae.1
MEYSEYMQQTLRLYSETEEMTVAMIKTNLKLPTPTLYDGNSPQFNEWAEEVRSCLTVHNIYIDDLWEDSVKSQVPMAFNARYPQAIHYGEDHYDDYIDRWDAARTQWRRRSRTFYNSARH